MKNNFELHNDYLKPFPWQDVMHALENKGWVELNEFFSKELMNELLLSFQEKLEQDEFNRAHVGKGFEKSLEREIRNSFTSWIDDWSESDAFDFVNSFYHLLMHNLNQHFFLSMKRFESQFAFYPHGGFYKKHLDQLRGTSHRQVTSIVYLNDCKRGGELVVYKRDNKSEIDIILKPQKGSFILFFSGQIFHEVLPTYAPRYSLTTWMRDDLVL